MTVPQISYNLFNAEKLLQAPGQVELIVPEWYEKALFSVSAIRHAMLLLLLLLLYHQHVDSSRDSIITFGGCKLYEAS